jgi:spore coat polysaccharide biosynthesis predicted glycosyltransferase SpsG
LSSGTTININGETKILDTVTAFAQVASASDRTRLEITTNVVTAIATELDRQGVIINLGWHRDVNIEQISLALQELIGDRAKREIMSNKGRELVDGNGASRVVSEMISMLV